MKIKPNTITLITPSMQSISLIFMGAFKGEPGTAGDDGEDGTDAVLPSGLRIPIIEWITEERFADPTDEFALIRGDYPTAQSFFLAEIPTEDVPKLGTGSYLSVRQKGAGQISFAAGEDEEVTLICPVGYLPKTRAQGAIVTLTCEAAGTNEWVLSGDLALEETP